MCCEDLSISDDKAQVSHTSLNRSSETQCFEQWRIQGGKGGANAPPPLAASNLFLRT